MGQWKKYRRTNLAEMRPYKAGEILPDEVSVSEADRKNGSPQEGDMIARNPENHNDKWLVAKEYFENNFEILAERRGNMTDEGHSGLYTTSDG